MEIGGDARQYGPVVNSDGFRAEGPGFDSLEGRFRSGDQYDDLRKARVSALLAYVLVGRIHERHSS